MFRHELTYTEIPPHDRTREFAKFENALTESLGRVDVGGRF